MLNLRFVRGYSPLEVRIRRTPRTRRATSNMMRAYDLSFDIVADNIPAHSPSGRLYSQGISDRQH
jgi:hypothetical protein